MSGRTPRILLSASFLSLAGCELVPTSGQASADCTWEVVDDVFQLTCDLSGGGSDAGGAGGGEPTPPPGNDTCSSPTFIDVAPGEHAFEHGTLAGARDDTATFCADPEGGDGMPDVVYQLSLSSECSTRITLDGATGFEGALSLRSASCAEDEYCTTAPGSLEVVQAVLESGTYWIVVTNVNGSVDDFTLSVHCGVPTCGDGYKNTNEACDDGNTLDGDGCDASCRTEAADVSLDTCEGAESAPPIAIGAFEVVRVPSEAPMRTTIGATDSGTGSCMLEPDGEFLFAAPDHVYRVRPTSSGNLKVTLGLGFDDVPLCGANPGVEPVAPYPTGCYDRALHVRSSACVEAANEVACSDSASAWWAPEEVIFPVVADQDYFVFVDGYNDDEYGVGAYVLRLELQ